MVNLHTWIFSQPAAGCEFCPKPKEWIGFPGCALRRPVDAHFQVRQKMSLFPLLILSPSVMVENKLLPCVERSALWKKRGNITHFARPNTWCVRARGGEDILTSALGKHQDGKKPPRRSQLGPEALLGLNGEQMSALWVSIIPQG